MPCDAALVADNIDTLKLNVKLRLDFPLDLAQPNTTTVVRRYPTDWGRHTWARGDADSGRGVRDSTCDVAKTTRQAAPARRAQARAGLRPRAAALLGR